MAFHSPHSTFVPQQTLDELVADINERVLIRTTKAKLPNIVESLLLVQVRDGLESGYINVGRFLVVLDQIVDKWIRTAANPTKVEHVNLLVAKMMKLTTLPEHYGNATFVAGLYRQIDAHHGCNGVKRLVAKFSRTMGKIIAYARADETSLLTLVNLLEEAVPIARSHAMADDAVYNKQMLFKKQREKIERQKKLERRQLQWKVWQEQKRNRFSPY